MSESMAQSFMPAAILDWLDEILKERISPHLVLSRGPGGTHLILSLPNSPADIRIASDFGSFSHDGSDLPCGRWDAMSEGWRSAIGQPLPAPGQVRGYGPLIERIPTGYVIHYDLLGMCFWMLSRREELGRTDLDSHGRFPSTASHAHRHDYLQRPVVDEWLYVLRQVAQRTWPNLPLASPRFSIRVSHDVDWPSRYGFGSVRQMLRLAAADGLKRHDARALRAPLIWQRSRRQLHPADPFNTFDWLMTLSEQHELTSAFYFICGRTDPARDAWYEPEDAAIRDLMRRIHQRGHEIGLHASYDTYRQPSVLAQEARRLRQICAEENIRQPQWGGRMHYLRWEMPTTLYGWERAGMDYDNSLTYADAAGFRCGTCFSYQAFDARQNQRLRLRIQPLIAMEKSVIGPAYQNLAAGESARAVFTQLKDACQAVGGCFTLLWHNSELDDTGRRTLYAALLGSSAQARSLGSVPPTAR
jgi:hypothetical protein